MLINLGQKITSIRDQVSVIQDRVQVILNPFADTNTEIVAYAQLGADGGIDFIAYLKRFGQKLKCSGSISAYLVAPTTWGETAIFENLAMTESADLTLKLSRTLSQVGSESNGEFLILVKVRIVQRSKILWHEFYVSDVGIYSYADFLRRKIVFLDINKKDFP